MIFDYLASFGATTLHNGTTHNGQQIITNPPKARVKTITLPNGVLYDPDVSSVSAQIPEIFEYSLFLKYSSEATAVTEFEALAGLIGTKATVTGTKPGGGTATCTARLVSLKDRSPSTMVANHRRLTLSFQPFTNWSNL